MKNEAIEQIIKNKPTREHTEKRIEPFPKIHEEEIEEDPKSSLPSPMSLFPPFQFLATSAPMEDLAISPVHNAMMEITEPVQVTCYHMEENGITTTSLDISAPSLGEITVEIQRFDTDPSSFHIQLIAEPTNRESLETNLAALEKSLQAALKDFRVHPLEISYAPFLTKSTQTKKGIVKTQKIQYREKKEKDVNDHQL